MYVKLQPYRQLSVVHRSLAKLSPRFFGPYEIIARLGPVAYRLALPPGSHIHDVFHVSLLRKHFGPLPSDPLPISASAKDSVMLQQQPEKILDRRVVQRGKYQPQIEVLIKWKNQQVEDATWEHARRLSQTFPEFQFSLTDKVV